MRMLHSVPCQRHMAGLDRWLVSGAIIASLPQCHRIMHGAPSLAGTWAVPQILWRNPSGSLCRAGATPFLSRRQGGQFGLATELNDCFRTGCCFMEGPGPAKAMIFDPNLEEDRVCKPSS